MLAQEGYDDVARKATDRGKAMHRDWVRDAFAPGRPTTRRVLDLLVVATDVYTWKLLRIDRGHSRAVTERRMHDLVDAVLAVGRTARSTEMAEILFVTWDGGGNVPPAVGIAAELRRRGHRVRFVGHAPSATPLEAQGFEVAADHARAPVRGRRPAVRARDDPDVRRPGPGPRRDGRARPPSRRPRGRRLLAASA